jgi:hypothetical protein
MAKPAPFLVSLPSVSKGRGHTGRSIAIYEDFARVQACLRPPEMASELYR